MKLRVNIEDLDFMGVDAGCSEMYDYQGQPFTGILVEKDGDVIIVEAEYQNGYLEGLQRKYYYPSGNIYTEYTKVSNNLDGTFREWDKQGTLVSESEWQNGIKVL